MVVGACVVVVVGSVVLGATVVVLCLERSADGKSVGDGLGVGRSNSVAAPLRNKQYFVNNTCFNFQL